MSYPTFQKNRCLDECTGYYGNWCSISSYGISCFLCARYDVTPPKIQSKCDGCGTSVDVHHVLICRKGGLIITHHNKVSSELLYLAQLPLLSASVHSKPLIHQGRRISEGGICQGSEKLDTRGVVLICGLCGKYTDTIIDIKRNNDDAHTYMFEPMVTLLEWWDKMKTDNHGNHYHKQQKCFPCLLFLLMGC